MTTEYKASKRYLKLVAFAVNQVGHHMSPGYLRYFSDILLTGRLVIWTHTGHGSTRDGVDRYIEALLSSLLLHIPRERFMCGGYPGRHYRSNFAFYYDLTNITDYLRGPKAKVP